MLASSTGADALHRCPKIELPGTLQCYGRESLGWKLGSDLIAAEVVPWLRPTKSLTWQGAAYNTVTRGPTYVHVYICVHIRKEHI